MPTLTTFELAEQSRLRALTAAEVDTVMANPISGFVYLESVLTSAAPGVTYVVPASRPTGCLVEPMHAYYQATLDGALSDAELDTLAKQYRSFLYYSHSIATGGGEDPRILSRLVALGHNPQDGSISRYYAAKANEPAAAGGQIAYYFREFGLELGLAIARFIEIGAPARDALVAGLARMTLPSPGSSAHLGYRMRVSAAIYVLGAAGDPRLQPGGAISAGDEALVGPSVAAYLMKRRGESGRDLSMEKAVHFWKSTCGRWPDRFRP